MPDTRVRLPPSTSPSTRAVSSNGKQERVASDDEAAGSSPAPPLQTPTLKLRRGSDVTGNIRVFQTRFEGSTPFSRILHFTDARVAKRQRRRAANPSNVGSNPTACSLPGARTDARRNLQPEQTLKGGREMSSPRLFYAARIFSARLRARRDGRVRDTLQTCSQAS
jgi:hypothetical protein